MINYRMKIAICDDDEKDRQTMLRLVSKYLDMHGYHIRIDEFHTGEAFLAADVTRYDLVVLDIYMGELNGIETARRIIDAHPAVQIIFCSSSNAYAAESYDVAALRYLLKPVAEERLFLTLDRFFYAHTNLRTLNYKQNRMEESVYLTDILWIEAGDHMSIIHTKTGQIETRTLFTRLCEQLEDADFIKPIRYALVSLDAVAAVPSGTLTLTDGTEIPISRGQRQDVKKAFSDYKMRSLLHKSGLR